MEEEIYKRSLALKCIIWFFNCFGLYSLILFVKTESFYTLVVIIPCLLFLSFYTIRIYVKYIFRDNEIIVKYPFKNEKVYLIEDIIGFEFYRQKTENWFIVYFKDKKIKLNIDVKKFREKSKIFYKKHYEIICQKNIEKIKTKGFEIIISKNKLVFFDNRVEINGKTERVYFYDKDIQKMQYSEIFEQFKRIDIVTKDNYRINLLSYKCKSGIGLFEYLSTVIKCPNFA